MAQVCNLYRGGLGRPPRGAMGDNEKHTACKQAVPPTTVTAKCLKDNSDEPTENEWSNASACFTSTNFDLDGGRFGFMSGHNMCIDNLTIKSWDGDSWETEVWEGFDNTSMATQETLTHDKAGNLTYDGRYKFAYDAWGRMVEVRRGYRNSQGALTDGSVVATIGYDGLSRRIVKDVDNSGDWDCAYHYYYSGQRMIETRNGSDNVLKQHLWGLGYVDELVQIAINDDPADAGEDNCETFYYAMQDANYNVLGLVDSSGDLAERYEYTPYGQRTVYTSAGTNDPQCMSPLLESKRVEVSTIKQPYGICDIGHQGLAHDKEFDWIANRARYLIPHLGRTNRPDPLEYIDGMNRFEYVGSNPIIATDPTGQWINYDKKHPHYWCADKATDTLQSLAKGKYKSKGSWVCLWPISTTARSSHKLSGIHEFN